MSLFAKENCDQPKNEEQKRRRYFVKNEKKFIEVNKEQKMGPRSVYMHSALPFVHAAG